MTSVGPRFITTLSAVCGMVDGRVCVQRFDSPQWCFDSHTATFFNPRATHLPPSPFSRFWEVEKGPKFAFVDFQGAHTPWSSAKRVKEMDRPLQDIIAHFYDKAWNEHGGLPWLVVGGANNSGGAPKPLAASPPILPFSSLFLCLASLPCRTPTRW